MAFPSDFHPTWVHWTSGGATLFLISLLHEGLRTRFSDLILKRIMNAWRTFWGIEKKDPSKPAKKTTEDCVSQSTFNEHVRGEEQFISWMKGALDQNANVVQKGVWFMNEKSELIAISQKEIRQELNASLGEMHDKVNMNVSKVDTLTGKLDILIPLVQEQLKNGKNGTAHP